MALSQEMLTGDNDITAKEIAEQLGLDIWQANVTPRQKMQIIEQCGLADKRPLMVGDGLNDAPALAAATASVSFSSASDISRTASDIIVQNDKLLNLPVAISTARSAQKRVIENLSLAVIYNMCAIPLAVLGWVNPLIAALAMSGSSLIVTLNALRVRTK
jgi:Cu2+-exporting ATPase